MGLLRGPSIKCQIIVVLRNLVPVTPIHRPLGVWCVRVNVSSPLTPLRWSPKLSKSRASVLLPPAFPWCPPPCWSPKISNFNWPRLGPPDPAEAGPQPWPIGPADPAEADPAEDKKNETKTKKICLKTSQDPSTTFCSRWGPHLLHSTHLLHLSTGLLYCRLGQYAIITIYGVRPFVS